jgi:hypothetical protein
MLVAEAAAAGSMAAGVVAAGLQSVGQALLVVLGERLPSGIGGCLREYVMFVTNVIMPAADVRSVAKRCE